jgi:hypothetical protein
VNRRETLKSFLVWMFIATHKRESGIPSNRGSRHGEFVNKLVHTARTLWKWGRMKMAVTVLKHCLYI